MKIAFIYWAYEDQGSGLDLRGYVRAAKALGHELTVYGPSNPAIPLDHSKVLDGIDALVCVFEWTTWLQNGDRLDWARLLSAIPRERRVVIDCDGQYNEVLRANGDHNHRDSESSRRWIEFCDSVSDKILQPSLHPRRANVRPFLFHIYDATWETPFDAGSKEFGMIYVGHSKFRWKPMSRVLDAATPVRSRL